MTTQEDDNRPSKGGISATLRSTGGAGFDFEDHISAWLMVKMLVGEPAPAIGGRPIQVQAQVETLGWRMDDLLLTVAGDGQIGRLAISAKGNVQVTASGLPGSFVDRAWQQWREKGGPFVKGRDGLALMPRDNNAAFNAAWREVKSACAGSDASLSLSRIRGAAAQSLVFDSVRYAAGTPVDATDEEAIDLIRHLHVLPVDFHLDHSNLKTSAIAQCRSILLSGDLAEAEAIWNGLVKTAADVRLGRGTLPITTLWSELRKLYALKDHPEYVRDWKTFHALTIDHMGGIETALPSGHTVVRFAERAKLEAEIKINLITVVVGDSGTGKSALVKLVLDDKFGDDSQIWFEPSVLSQALSAARRGALPLLHDPALSLNGGTNARNILVLDAAEHIATADLPKVRRLLEALQPPGTDPVAPAWRIVVIAQTQGWIESSDALLGKSAVGLVEIDPLTEREVKAALRDSPALSWLTAHDDTVAALTNLKTLSWVVKAGPALGSSASGLASHTAVADRLWRYWTGDAVDVQALTMRLAEREARFERSFPLTSFEAAEHLILRNLPDALPLRLNEQTNHVVFEHDLAADWARFQFLKQIASDTPRWAAFAQNPLWTNALRILGQFFLRQSAGDRTAWDVAFEQAEATGLPLAGDVLLDALCLDPEAERFLTERLDLLLTGKPMRLVRLLARFRHIATIPSRTVLDMSQTIGIYLEANYRSLIVGRWPPVLKFLSAHRERISELASPTVAKLCEVWLNGTPAQIANGTPTPWRKDVTELALAAARTVQYEKAKGVMYLMDDVTLYTAPLAGAGDLPDPVGTWALELAGRREIDVSVANRIAAARKERTEEHTAKLKSDPEYRRRQAQKSVPFSVSSREKLPPWPLGAKWRVDSDFRKACLKQNGLMPMMRANPDVAAEVLLALLIEDEPYREYGADYGEIDLGLERGYDGFPSIYWKSPFFQFLQLAPESAFNALIALVDFCTERWAAAAPRHYEGPLPAIRLKFDDGNERNYLGDATVFGWSQGQSHQNGGLFAALDALEKWLTDLLSQGREITPHVNRLFREGRSASLIGVLVNLGKARPALLAGDLAPLLSSPLTFYWDKGRVDQLGYSFPEYQWATEGQMLLDLARAWSLASSRRQTLQSFAVELLKSDASVAARVKSHIPSWTIPTEPIRAIEFEQMIAALDRDNYQPIEMGDGQETLALMVPPGLQAKIDAWNAKNEGPRTYLHIPAQCQQALQQQVEITDEGADYLAAALRACDADNAVEPETTTRCRLAIAATLIVCAEEWLAARPDVRDEALDVIRSAVAGIADTIEGLRESRHGMMYDHLSFVAYAAVHMWRREADPKLEWESAVLRLLTSGDLRAEGTVVSIAYHYRTDLGSAWWRLLFAGMLWSALSALSPGYDDKDGHLGRLWARWLQRLRSMPIRGHKATIESLAIARIARGYERLDYDRRLRAYDSGDTRWRGEPKRRTGYGLGPHILDVLFRWLFAGAGTDDWHLDAQLVGLLWTEEVTRQEARTNDRGEYDLPSTFGYELLDKLAALVLTAPAGGARPVWESVLSHGGPAHVGLRRFIGELFRQVSKGGGASAFETEWRAMIEYALAGTWRTSPRTWYDAEQITGDLLGFGAETAFGNLPGGLIERFRDLYERWAAGLGGRDEDILKRFCYFLTSKFGAPLRLDAVCWINDGLTHESRLSHWYRPETSDALLELLNVVTSEDGGALVKHETARQAVVTLVASLVARNNLTALALQERIKRLR